MDKTPTVHDAARFFDTHTQQEIDALFLPVGKITYTAVTGNSNWDDVRPKTQHNWEHIEGEIRYQLCRQASTVFNSYLKDGLGDRAAFEATMVRMGSDNPPMRQGEGR